MTVPDALPNITNGFSPARTYDLVLNKQTIYPLDHRCSRLLPPCKKPSEPVE